MYTSLMTTAKKPIKYIVHSNKYGWVIRLGGWTGPTLMRFKTKDEAVKVAMEGERGIDWALEAAEIEEILISD